MDKVGETITPIFYLEIRPNYRAKSQDQRLLLIESALRSLIFICLFMQGIIN
jgi:hypothetical protein